MSSQDQSSPNQKPVEDWPPHVADALRIAAIIAEANERLFRIQSEAANAAFAENSRHLKALLDPLNSRDSKAMLAQWSGLYQANMRRALDVTRSCFEVVPQTQGEIAKLMGEPFASADKETRRHLDRITKAISDGRDAATATMEAFLTKAMGAGSARSAAKPKAK